MSWNERILNYLNDTQWNLKIREQSEMNTQEMYYDEINCNWKIPKNSEIKWKQLNDDDMKCSETDQNWWFSVIPIEFTRFHFLS